MDLIDRQAAIEVADAVWSVTGDKNVAKVWDQLRNLPSAQPDYQEVLGWLLAYHTKSFELKGTYKPHEVISWLINDISRTLFEGTEE